MGWQNEGLWMDGSEELPEIRELNYYSLKSDGSLEEISAASEKRKGKKKDLGEKWKGHCSMTSLIKVAKSLSQATRKESTYDTGRIIFWTSCVRFRTTVKSIGTNLFYVRPNGDDDGDGDEDDEVELNVRLNSFWGGLQQLFPDFDMKLWEKQHKGAKPGSFSPALDQESDAASAGSDHTAESEVSGDSERLEESEDTADSNEESAQSGETYDSEGSDDPERSERSEQSGSEESNNISERSMELGNTADSSSEEAKPTRHKKKARAKTTNKSETKYQAKNKKSTSSTVLPMTEQVDYIVIGQEHIKEKPKDELSLMVV